MKRVKRQLTEWEEIFVNDTLSDKELVTRLCKELLHPNKKNPSLKWVKDLNRHLSKDIQMANEHINRCSTSSAIRKYRCTL